MSNKEKKLEKITIELVDNGLIVKYYEQDDEHWFGGYDYKPPKRMFAKTWTEAFELIRDKV